MSTRRGALLGVLAILALSFAGLGSACSRRAGARTSRTAPARRIVSLAPSTTEALFAIGAGDLVVGRTRFCDWPPEASRLPALGGMQPDIESILELRPDLVVGVGGIASEQLASKLGARGIATWFLATDSLASIDALLTGLGQRTGREADAARLVGAIDSRERAITEAVAHAPRPRVLMVASLHPIVVAGPTSFADEMIRRAGAVNSVGAGGAWPTLGFERVLDLDPDVIVDLTVVATGGPTLITPNAHGWAGVRAVREGHVVAIADSRVLRAGPRIAEGLAVLARALHPGAAIP